MLEWLSLGWFLRLVRVSFRLRGWISRLRRNGRFYILNVTYEAVAKVRPSLANAMQFIGYFANIIYQLHAFVGFVITYPFSALYTTSMSEIATNSKVPYGLNVQLNITLELGGSGLGWINKLIRFVRTTFKLGSFEDLNVSKIKTK